MVPLDIEPRVELSVHVAGAADLISQVRVSVEFLEVRDRKESSIANLDACELPVTRVVGSGEIAKFVFMPRQLPTFGHMLISAAPVTFAEGEVAVEAEFYTPECNSIWAEEALPLPLPVGETRLALTLVPGPIVDVGYEIPAPLLGEQMAQWRLLVEDLEGSFSPYIFGPASSSSRFRLPLPNRALGNDVLFEIVLGAAAERSAPLLLKAGVNSIPTLRLPETGSLRVTIDARNYEVEPQSPLLVILLPHRGFPCIPGEFLASVPKQEWKLGRSIRFQHLPPGTHAAIVLSEENSSLVNQSGYWGIASGTAEVFSGQETELTLELPAGFSTVAGSFLEYRGVVPQAALIVSQDGVPIGVVRTEENGFIARLPTGDAVRIWGFSSDLPGERLMWIGEITPGEGNDAVLLGVERTSLEIPEVVSSGGVAEFSISADHLSPHLMWRGFVVFEVESPLWFPKSQIQSGIVITGLPSGRYSTKALSPSGVVLRELILYSK